MLGVHSDFEQSKHLPSVLGIAFGGCSVHFILCGSLMFFICMVQMTISFCPLIWQIKILSIETGLKTSKLRREKVTGWGKVGALA